MLANELHNKYAHFYVAKKNPRTKPEKMEVNKYNPKTRKHVKYVEKKIK